MAIERIFRQLGDGAYEWLATNYGTFVDVVPVADTKEHYLGDECWCNPDHKAIAGCPHLLLSHNALDGRV